MSTRKRDILSESKCFFVTTTFHKRLHLLIDDQCYCILADSIKYCLHKYTADIIAYVFMPNHIHLILFFRETPELSNFMRDFKKYTSVKIRQHLDMKNHAMLLEKLKYIKGEQKFKVWNDRYDAVIVQHRIVLATKMNYIHQNPVKRNLIDLPESWKYSSAVYYITGIDSVLSVRNAGEII